MGVMKELAENAAYAYQKNNPTKSWEEAMNYVCTNHSFEYWDRYIANNLEPAKVNQEGKK